MPSKKTGKLIWTGAEYLRRMPILGQSARFCSYFTTPWVLAGQHDVHSEGELEECRVLEEGGYSVVMAAAYRLMREQSQPLLSRHRKKLN